MLTCRQCGRAFKPRTSWHEFCEPRCRDRYWYLLRKAAGEFELRNELRRERKNGGPSTPEERAAAEEAMAALIKELKAKSLQTIRRRV